MSVNDIVDTFIELFKGRTDAYGTWGGGMVEYDGWSINTPIALHLQQGPYIGVYPVTDDNTTGWGCIDIDGKDHTYERTYTDGSVVTEVSWDEMWDIAGELQDVLAYKDVTSWLERTKNGIHVWVFAEKRVSAAVMRRALLVACEVAEYKPKEVNPKQEQVNPDKPYGNYVRLPYYGALKNGTPPDRYVLDDDGPMTVESFCRSAMGSRTPVSTLEAMAALFVPPVARGLDVEADAATAEAFRMLWPILPPVIQLIFEDGAIGDRSSTLVRAAKIMAEEGWRAQAAFTVLKALDERLGKFVGREDCDRQLLKIMETVGL